MWRSVDRIGIKVRVGQEKEERVGDIERYEKTMVNKVYIDNLFNDFTVLQRAVEITTEFIEDTV